MSTRLTALLAEAKVAKTTCSPGGRQSRIFLKMFRQNIIEGTHPGYAGELRAQINQKLAL